MFLNSLTDSDQISQGAGGQLTFEEEEEECFGANAISASKVFSIQRRTE